MSFIKRFEWLAKQLSHLYMYHSWRSERSECSHSQVIKIEICDRYMFGTCKSYVKKVIAMAMTFDGLRSSCRSDVEKTGQC